jgi:hypothetical protein
MLVFLQRLFDMLLHPTIRDDYVHEFTGYWHACTSVQRKHSKITSIVLTLICVLLLSAGALGSMLLSRPLLLDESAPPSKPHLAATEPGTDTYIAVSAMRE